MSGGKEKNKDLKTDSAGSWRTRTILGDVTSFVSIVNIILINRFPDDKDKCTYTV